MPASVSVAHPGEARDRNRQPFFTTIAVANLLIIVCGFGYSTYARLQLGDTRFGGPTLPMLVRLHAAASMAWTLLLIVQARLIASRRVRLHRRVGVGGGLIAVAVVGLGWIVAVSATRRGVMAGEPAATEALRFFILPFQELVVFSLMVGAALWLRKREDYHKRLMALGTLALIPAGTTRLPGQVLGTLTMHGLPEMVFLLALCVHDRRRGHRVHRATRWGGGLLLVTAVSRSWIAGTAAWLALARALVG